MKSFAITTSDLASMLDISPQRILTISNECKLDETQEAESRGKFKIYTPSGVKKILAKRGITNAKTKVLAFGNNKGGVGKSSTASNTALMLSSLGYKTLLIDSDGQANTTSFFLSPETEAFCLVEILMKQKTLEEATIKLSDTLSIIPSNLYNQSLPKILSDKPRNTLKNLIAPLMSSFDFIIWDCNPSLDITNQQIYYSCTDVFIVTLMEAWSLQGVEMTRDTLLSCFEDTTVKYPNVYVLINKLDNRIGSQINLYSKLESLKLEIFSVTIETDNNIPKSQNEGYVLTNKNKTFKSYLEFATKIIIGNTKSPPAKKALNEPLSASI